MLVAVLGHRGMLGRRVLEEFPDALTFKERYSGETVDPLLKRLEQVRPDWIINCIGRRFQEPDLWNVNAVLPHRLRNIARLVQPSTDHVWDDSEYARSKRLGETGHVIRCAIVDPDGGMLARARERDTIGETGREWNGITAKSWARIARDVVEGRLTGTVLPGSPTVTHYDVLQSARHVFGWPTRTIPGRLRIWRATPPSLMLPPIERQLAEYL